MFNQKEKIILFIIIILTLAPLSAYSQKNIIKDDTMNNSKKMSKRLEVLFLKTKLLCFGRYALEVPKEAELILGDASIPSTIEITKGKLVENDDRILKAIKKIEKNDSSSEIVYNGKGPLENSWQIQYFDSKFAKEDGALYFKTYVTKGDLTFILMGSIPKGGTIASAAAKQLMRAKSLRLRDSDEVPVEPGYCIEAGFMSEDDYDNQEMVDAGLYLPSFPDVAFSVTANKDAYSDYPPEEFEKKVRGKLSLLARTQQAKDQQGKNYPKRTLLREGKRDVQHWHGEESLIRRTDGVHDFEWALVGKPGSIAYPSVIEASMYTKVEHNMVGAAEAASLSDEEAIALWDKLLSGLKFRVKVPGAPPGSYYIDPDKPKPVPAS